VHHVLCTVKHKGINGTASIARRWDKSDSQPTLLLAQCEDRSKNTLNLLAYSRRRTSHGWNLVVCAI
jgi:hypothetical protein